MTEPAAAIILAAGASSRMGRPKQLLEIGGEALVARTVNAVLEAGLWPVIVVLGANHETIKPALARLPVIAVVNGAWAEGMASSLRAGISALRQFSRTTPAALIALCDQPAFSAAVARKLIVALEGGVEPGGNKTIGGEGDADASPVAVRPSPAQPNGLPTSSGQAFDVIGEQSLAQSSPMGIAAARYDGRLGAPAVFRRKYFTELAGLSGDQGARVLLKTHAEDVAAVDLPELALDLDTPADWAAFQSR